MLPFELINDINKLHEYIDNLENPNIIFLTTYAWLYLKQKHKYKIKIIPGIVFEKDKITNEPQDIKCILWLETGFNNTIIDFNKYESEKLYYLPFSKLDDKLKKQYRKTMILHYFDKYKKLIRKRGYSDNFYEIVKGNESNLNTIQEELKTE
jgi:hypothetical protein